MTVRAKFTVLSVTKQKNGKQDEGSSIIKLCPVTGGSEENKQFWRWTPAGSIELHCVNPTAAAAFEPGEEFYVDFTKAE